MRVQTNRRTHTLTNWTDFIPSSADAGGNKIIIILVVFPNDYHSTLLETLQISQKLKKKVTNKMEKMADGKMAVNCPFFSFFHFCHLFFFCLFSKPIGHTVVKKRNLTVRNLQIYFSLEKRGNTLLYHCIMSSPISIQFWQKELSHS